MLFIRQCDREEPSQLEEVSEVCRTLGRSSFKNFRGMLDIINEEERKKKIENFTINSRHHWAHFYTHHRMSKRFDGTEQTKGPAKRVWNNNNKIRKNGKDLILLLMQEWLRKKYNILFNSNPRESFLHYFFSCSEVSEADASSMISGNSPQISQQ